MQVAVLAAAPVQRERHAPISQLWDSMTVSHRHAATIQGRMTHAFPQPRPSQ